MLKRIALSTHTSGSMSTFLPAANSNEYIFIRADIAYAFRNRRKLLNTWSFLKEFASNWIVYNKYTNHMSESPTKLYHIKHFEVLFEN